jgi:hypothetical protein
MKRSPVLLVVTAVLFLAWIGWLAYLVVITRHPAPEPKPIWDLYVLARPQFLVAELYVIAEVSANPAGGQADDVVTIKKVLWSANQADIKRAKILVKNLDAVDAQHGWQGPGEYILALTRAGRRETDVFLVTSLPRTPGFAGDALGRIYVATPPTLRQLEKLKEEFHP